jgi:hypothetical protein
MDFTGGSLPSSADAAAGFAFHAATSSRLARKFVVEAIGVDFAVSTNHNDCPRTVRF